MLLSARPEFLPGNTWNPLPDTVCFVPVPRETGTRETNGFGNPAGKE
jgi:hypothetical protein